MIKDIVISIIAALVASLITWGVIETSKDITESQLEKLSKQLSEKSDFRQRLIEDFKGDSEFKGKDGISLKDMKVQNPSLVSKDGRTESRAINDIFYCAISELTFNHSKTGSTKICSVEMTSPNNWLLKAKSEPGQVLTCRANCF
jgi:hypothetical protein